MILLALVLSGLQAAFRIPLGRIPDLSIPRVIVEAFMPGLPAAEVRSLLTLPLEDALASAKNLSRMSSVSRDGRVLIVLDFKWGERSAIGAGRVREILDSVYPSLPEGAEKPTVLPFNADHEPLMVVTVASRDGDLAYARRLAEYEVRARLRRVEGAGEVSLYGGLKREIAVAVDMHQAAARGLTVYDIAGIIARESNDSPVGSLREGDLELVAMVKGRALDTDELASMVVSGPSGPFILSELALVGERNASRASIFVSGGEERVALEVYTQPGSDPVATARKARKTILEMAADYETTARIELIQDASIAISKSILDLASAGMIGAIAAAVALFIFLGDLKAGLLVAFSIPVSVAITLGMLEVCGRSLNSMSLGGMSLAIGMISDNAVVVHSALAFRFTSASSRPDADEVAEATGTALAGTFGSMITTSVVFVPVFFLPGAIGGLFGDLAISIIIANTAGWLVAVLALPSIYRLTWAMRVERRRRSLESRYRRALRIAFRHPKTSISVAFLAAFFGTILTITRVVSFMPPGAATELIVQAEFPAGTNPDGLADDACELTKVLTSIDGISGAYGGSGSEDDDANRRSDPGYSMEVLKITCPIKEDADVFAIRKSLLALTLDTLSSDVLITVKEAPDPVARLLDLDQGSSIVVRGSSVQESLARSQEFEAALELEAGVALAYISRWPAGIKPMVLMNPLRDNAATFGVPLSIAAVNVRAATEGVIAVRLDIKGQEMDVRVFAADIGRAAGSGSLAGMGSIPVSASRNAPVPAASIAEFSMTDGNEALARLDRADVVYLETESASGKKNELSKAIERVVATSEWAGRINDSAFHTYGTAMVSAVLLVLVLLYLTLGAQFESFWMPVLVMATIPLAMAGTGPLLLLTGTGLDSGSILGMIVLFGVVVNNAILLFETGSAWVSKGVDRVIAAYRGASERVRPVLATTMTTVVALIPLSLSGAGAMQRSISVAMLGGLIASTVLTLFVSPITFALSGASRIAPNAGSEP